MFRPHVGERELEIPETQEEPEDQLVSGDRFARDDEGQGELHVEIKGQGFDGCVKER